MGENSTIKIIQGKANWYSVIKLRMVRKKLKKSVLL